MQSYPVLLIAHAYSPENLIGAYRPARFARYLPEFGFEPWVLTASPQTGEASERVREVPFHYNWAELLLGKTFFPHDDRMTWTKKAEAAATDWLEQLPAKPLLFSTSPPLSSHWLSWNLAKRFDLAWVADFRDPLVANFGRGSRLGRMVDPWIEKRVVHRASMILMNTEAAAAELRGRYPAQANRIEALPNGYDPCDNFGPLPLPSRSRKIWFHGGSIYRNRYPERLFDGLWSLTKSERLPMDWCIRMIGTLEDTSLLERPSVAALRELGAIDVDTNVLPKSQALREAAEANATIVFDHYHASGVNLAIPAKSFDCVRVGRPILAFTSPRAPLDALLQSSGIENVRVYDTDPPEIIAEKLLHFAALPPEAKVPSEAFRLAHSAPEQTQRLASFFTEVLSRKGMLTS